MVHVFHINRLFQRLDCSDSHSIRACDARRTASSTKTSVTTGANNKDTEDRTTTTIGIKATTTTLVVPVETVPITTSKAANLRKDDDTAPTTQRLKQVSVPTALKGTVIQDATRRFLAKKLQSEQENLNDSDELEVTMVKSPATKFRETNDLAVASGNVISLESPESSPTPPPQHEGRGQEGGGGGSEKKPSSSSTSTSTSAAMVSNSISGSGRVSPSTATQSFLIRRRNFEASRGARFSQQP